eukprot:8519439-Alexandrium_andersonii.AAC.1
MSWACAPLLEVSPPASPLFRAVRARPGPKPMPAPRSLGLGLRVGGRCLHSCPRGRALSSGTAWVEG